MAYNSFGLASRARSRSWVFDCGVRQRSDHASAVRFPGEPSFDFAARFHMDTVALIVPVRGPVDDLQIRDYERVALEFIQTFPLNFARADHLALGRLTVSCRV